MLLSLYYLCKKSPKKSRELASIVEDLKGAFEFPKSGNFPIRCQGTTQKESSSMRAGSLWSLHCASDYVHTRHISQGR